MHNKTEQQKETWKPVTVVSFFPKKCYSGKGVKNAVTTQV